MLMELNKTTGGHITKKKLVQLALKYGDTQYLLGSMIYSKEYRESEFLRKEVEKLKEKRNKLLNEILSTDIEY